MKTLTKTLSIDSRFLHLYRPLVRRVAIVFAITAVMALAALLFFDEQLVKRMSSNLIDSVSASVDAQIQRRLSSSGETLMIAIDQVQNVPLGEETSDGAFAARLVTFLETYPIIDSINFADTLGNEFAVLRDEDGFLTRRIDAAEPEVARWHRLRGGEFVESWERNSSASPTERPWFIGAMQQEPRQRYWTEPYEFLTTGDPGISVATRAQPTDAGPERVMAFNLSLIDVSRMTMAQRPTENGIAFVFDESGRILGLPRNDRFEDERSILGAALQPVEDLGMPELTAALANWREAGSEESVFEYAGPTGKTWWAGLLRVRLDADYAIWSAVLVPRSDLLGRLVATRNLVIMGIIAAGVVVAALIFLAAMRSIRHQIHEAVDRIEQRLGQYHIEEKIGEGGNGTVYSARHALLRRPTALKLMNPEFARSEAARKRFEHEVRLTSGLSHPNTVAIYDFGQTTDGTLYYAMELLEGSTLNRLVQVSGPLPAGRAIHFLVQVCGSLAEAHGKGLIHRDIKPSNLIVSERGGVFDVLKVVDFGLVKEMAEVDGNLTQADVLIGTPFFMAPEIISQPGAASPHSDIYALGAVGYYILSGRHVFEGASAVEICAAHLHDQPERPSRKAGRAIPEDLENVLLACLEKDPAARPVSADALRDAFLECADAGTWTASDAKAWWQEYSTGLADELLDEEAVSMSRSGLLVDLDSRLISRPAADEQA